MNKYGLTDKAYKRTTENGRYPIVSTEQYTSKLTGKTYIIVLKEKTTAIYLGDKQLLGSSVANDVERSIAWIDKKEAKQAKDKEIHDYAYGI